MLAGIVPPNILIFTKKRQFCEQSIILLHCNCLAIVLLVFKVEGFLIKFQFISQGQHRWFPKNSAKYLKTAFYHWVIPQKKKSDQKTWRPINIEYIYFSSSLFSYFLFWNLLVRNYWVKGSAIISSHLVILSQLKVNKKLSWKNISRFTALLKSKGLT